MKNITLLMVFLYCLQVVYTNKLPQDSSLPWRLPSHITPLHYNISLVPILEAGYENVEGLGPQWSIPGKVDIFIQVKNDTKTITLHAGRHLAIGSTAIYDENGIHVRIDKTAYNSQYSLYTITLSEEVNQGSRWIVGLEFTAKVSDFRGLRRGKYTDPSTNMTNWLAVTQLQPEEPRQIFPCFDEPSFKATFQVAVGRLENYMAITNTGSLSNTTMVKNWVWEQFETTPIMSTHHLSIAVCTEYGYFRSTLENMEVAVYLPSHLTNATGWKYTADISLNYLSFMKSRYQVAYPLTKLHMMAAPQYTWGNGVSSTLGFNIYHDSWMQYPETLPETDRLRLLLSFGHEISRHWFGNLIAPSWWTHIWVTEGMSRFNTYLGLETVAPEFMPWELFVNDVFQHALEYEGKWGYATLKRDEYDRAYWTYLDYVTLDKGACMVRMMEGFLTPPVFYEGIQRAVQSLTNGSIHQEDLFSYLTTVGHEFGTLPFDMTLELIMKGWTQWSGYPLLNVTRVEDVVRLTQSPYGVSAGDLWTIPISYASEENKNFDSVPEIWLNKGFAEFNDSSIWIILNAGTTGYYRIIYDDTLRESIVTELNRNHSTISAFCRSQVIDDYFTFMYEGQTEIESTLDFTKYLISGEDSITVWKSFDKHMHQFRITSNEESRQAGTSYILPRIQTALETIGGVDMITPESKGSPVLRHNILLSWAMEYEDPSTSLYVDQLMELWKRNVTHIPVHPDLRRVIYCEAVRQGEFSFLYERYLASKGLNYFREIYPLLMSLSCTTRTDEMEALLYGILANNFYHDKSHGSDIMRALMANRHARNSTLEFLLKNEALLLEKYDGDRMIIVLPIYEIPAYVTSTEQVEELQQYLIEGDFLFDFEIAYLLSEAEGSVKWFEMFAVPMSNYFMRNSVNQINKN